MINAYQSGEIGGRAWGTRLEISTSVQSPGFLLSSRRKPRVFMFDKRLQLQLFSAPHFQKCVRVGLFSDKDFNTGVFHFRLRIQCLLDNGEVKPLSRTKVWKGVIFLQHKMQSVKTYLGLPTLRLPGWAEIRDGSFLHRALNKTEASTEVSVIKDFEVSSNNWKYKLASYVTKYTLNTLWKHIKMP